MARIRKEKEHGLAHGYYMNTDKTAKEIAELVGISEKQLGEWIKKGEWEVLKAAQTMTADSILRDLYYLVNEITSAARIEKRKPTAAETDQIVKLTKSIEQIKKKENLSQYIQVFENFMKFLMTQNAKLAKEVIKYQDDFVNIKAHELQ